jgi:hypothetical protein
LIGVQSTPTAAMYESANTNRSAAIGGLYCALVHRGRPPSAANRTATRFVIVGPLKSEYLLTDRELRRKERRGRQQAEDRAGITVNATEGTADSLRSSLILRCSV